MRRRPSHPAVAPVASCELVHIGDEVGRRTVVIGERKLVTSSGRPFMLDRRAFLVALGVVPAAALLVSCSEDEAAQPLKQVDMTGSDPAIRPQDDLYRHVNGKWLREYQLPPDKVSYG